MSTRAIRICLKTRHPGFFAKLLTSDPKLLCVLSDKHGNQTERILLETDTRFQVLKTEDTKCLTGDISEVTVSLPRRRFRCCRRKVYLARVTVNYDKTSRTFPFHCEITESGTTAKYHAVLPQDDPDRRSRTERIQSARDTYKPRERNGKWSIPARVANLPEAEGFSAKYLTFLFVSVLLWCYYACVGGIRKLSGTKHKFDILKDLYSCPVPDTTCCQPKTGSYTPRVSLYWDTDEWFGLQRLVGMDPTIIRLCKTTEPPTKTKQKEAQPEDRAMQAADPDEDKLLRDSKDRLEEHHLGGKTVAAALKEKRLFVCNLTFMKDFSRARAEPTVPAPIALFYLRQDGDLVPVAIRLSPQQRVFFPPVGNESKYTWISAKMWYNLAESNHHETTTHLMLTHLLMESFCLATHRHLDVSHPVFRLLWPHFHFLMAINNAADKTLLRWGIDQILNIGIQKGLELGKARLLQWRIDVEGTLPAALEERGLADPTILKDKYLYRDDAMKLYNVLKKYATAYIKHYYRDEGELSSDWEIQEWAKALAGEYQIKGVPNDGQLKTRDQLILMVTCIIYTCSVGHASVNFAQYDQYGYPPNYPGCLKGSLPDDPNKPLGEEDAFKALPSWKNMHYAMRITHLLSQRGDRRLAEDFEIFIVDQSDEIRACTEELKKGLRQIKEEIRRRNSEYARQDPFHMMLYDYLDPSNIPNSIGI